MRGILVVVVLLVIVFFTVPMVSEGTTNACQAVEKHNVSATAENITGTTNGPVHNVINAVGQAGATGQVASADASSSAPNTPTPITCTVEYWQDIL